MNIKAIGLNVKIKNLSQYTAYSVKQSFNLYISSSLLGKWNTNIVQAQHRLWQRK